MYRLRLADQLKNLLLACNRLSDVEGAADARRRLAELEATDPRFAALDERLRAVAKGEAPKDNTERLALAQRAYDTKRYVLAARLWGEASENDPELAADRQTQPRYNAACAAALAACGPGSDEPSLDEGARAELRAQALAWLKLELVAWAGLVESGALPDRSSVVRTLKHWQSDSDLVGIRDESALGKLPEVERVALTGLWSEVERVLKKVEGVE
jgi:hypothetical protein